MFIRIAHIGLTFLLMTFFAQGQDDIIGIGDWRVHAPFSKAQIIESAGNRVYGASTEGLFYFDQEDESINKLSKIDGLSDIGITIVRYYEEKDVTIFGYSNGNIDLLIENSLYNINDVKRSKISGSKRINAIEFRESSAYLSCDFGVVRLNLDELEIKESYRNIGPDGIQPKVFDSAIDFKTDSIFLATSVGLLGASLLPQYNLLDFNSWDLITDTSNNPITGTEKVEIFHDTLLIATTNSPIIALKNGQMHDHHLPWQENGSLSILRTSNDKLFIGQDGKLTWASSLLDTTSTSLWPVFRPSDALIDDKGVIWVADDFNGVLSNREGSFKTIGPNGPASSEIFHFYAYEDEIIAAGGGYNTSFSPLDNPRGFYIFDQNEWTTYSSKISTAPEFKDVTSAVYNEQTNKFYFGSYGNGLLVWDRTNFSRINDTTPGSSLLPVSAGGHNVKITGLATDDFGNTWMISHESAGPSVHKLSPSGEFTGYTLTSDRGNFLADIDIDAFGTKWLTRGGSNSLGGIIVFDDQTGEELLLTTSLGNGGLPVNKVNGLAIDKENAVWVGLTEGVAVFYETENIFKASSINATLPIFEGRPLLQDEVVNCITIDGGNRKWIGTSNGLFLFDDNGTKALVNFNVDNSPLPSNNIVDVGINENTGEVFIGTDFGIISYWGTATEAEETHADDILIFPNPVRPDFDGIVGISGLAQDATVKITDISGKLIFETNAEGGLATWNTRDLDGVKAKSGIYMIFSSSVDGTDGFVGKLAIIE